MDDDAMREMVRIKALDAIQEARRTRRQAEKRATAAYADAVLETMYGDADTYFPDRSSKGYVARAQDRVQKDYRRHFLNELETNPERLLSLKEDIRIKYLHTCCVVSLFESWCVLGLFGFNRTEAACLVVDTWCPAETMEDWGQFKWHLYHRVYAIIEAYIKGRFDP